MNNSYYTSFYRKQVWYVPQTFLGQQALSSITWSRTSPSLSQTGGGSSLHSGSTAIMLPFSKQPYMQHPLTDPFQISPAEWGCPLLSVHAGRKEKHYIPSTSRQLPFPASNYNLHKIMCKIIWLCSIMIKESKKGW